jgi:hypothetical protein
MRWNRGDLVGQKALNVTEPVIGSAVLEIAEQLLGRRIRHDDPTVLVGHQHRVGHAGDGRVQLHLLLAQQIGGTFALAQVGVQLLDHQ